MKPTIEPSDLISSSVASLINASLELRLVATLISLTSVSPLTKNAPNVSLSAA